MRLSGHTEAGVGNFIDYVFNEPGNSSAYCRTAKASAIRMRAITCRTGIRRYAEMIPRRSFAAIPESLACYGTRRPGVM